MKYVILSVASALPLVALSLTAHSLTTLPLSSPDLAESQKQILLQIDFPPRDVAQIEVGNFRFLPGQLASVNTHAAPAGGAAPYSTDGVGATIVSFALSR